MSSTDQTIDHTNILAFRSRFLPFKGSTSFVDHLCYLCLVFVMLSRLLIAAMWSPAWKELTSLLLFVIFNLSGSHVVSLVRCGT